MRREYVRFSIAVIVCVAALVPVMASEPPAELPFDLLQRHLVVVRGSVGGLRNRILLIDTGTIPSVIDRRVAAKLRLGSEPSLVVAFGQTTVVGSARPVSIQIGPFDAGEVPATVGDLSYLEPAGVDAIVGLDVLARTSFSIDYAARRLVFAAERRESWKAPLAIVWPFATVSVTAAGQPMRLLVDTGSRDLVLFKSRMPAAVLPLPWKGDKVVRHVSGSARLLRYDLRDVSLGDAHWDTLPGFVLDASMAGYPPGIDGVLGVLALGSTRVHFDFARGELGWNR
jgi:Aspartyl protease